MLPHLILVPMAAVLLWLYLRDRRAIGQARESVLSACAGLLGPDVHTHYQQDGFPVVSGDYRGNRSVLRATVDTLILRKLPSLWLEASILTPIPYTARLSYLVRPVNTEFFSPSARLGRRLDIPADWPQEAAMLRTDETGTPPPLKIVGEHIKRICSDRRVKEVVVTPRGIRIVYLADEGERGTYLLLRQARFGRGPIDPALAGSLLDSALELSKALEAEKRSADLRPQLRLVPETGRKGRHEQDSVALQA